MMTMDDVLMSPERWRDRWTFFQGETQQNEGIALLYEAIRQSDPALLSESAEWAQVFSQKPAAAAPVKPVPARPQPAAPAAAANPLPVPWFSQLDNASGQGQRECFSSSCAMVAAFYGKVKSDDQYNAIRAGYGDSTNVNAQIAALRQLGLKARFHTDGTPELLKRLLARGIPVPCGWLHRGPVVAPSGGGHYSVVIGWEAGPQGERWIHNDPYGEADLVNGGYLANTNGHGKRYSFRNWNRRWMCEGPGTGWYLEITR